MQTKIVCFGFVAGIHYRKDYAIPLVDPRLTRAAITKLKIIHAWAQIGTIALDISAVIAVATPHYLYQRGLTVQRLDDCGLHIHR